MLATHQLIRQHQNCFQAELSVAEVEQVLQAGPQQIDDHDVVVAFNAIPAHVGNADCSDNEEGENCSDSRQQILARPGLAAYTHLHPARSCITWTRTRAEGAWS